MNLSEKIKLSDQTVTQTLCRMCEDHCGINVYLEDDRIVNVDGYKEHPWNKGRICVKGRAGIDLAYAPDRILKPLKKTADGWREIALEKALDEIADKIQTIQREYGIGAMSVWKGEAIGFAQKEGLYRRFIQALGSPNYFSNDTVCYVGRYIGYATVSGTYNQNHFADSGCVLIWGSNPPFAHPNMTQKIMAAKKNGATLIVIDPRVSTIARKANIYAQIKPGTDGALALGIVRQLIELNACDWEFIDKYTVGFEKLKAYVQDFTLEFVAKETGISTDTQRQIASAIAQNAPRITNYAGNGLEHHENGVNNIRAVSCIEGIMGAFDVKGGTMIPEFFNTRDLTLYDAKPINHTEPIGATKYPVLYDLRKECHTLMGMDTILSEEPYPLKGMIISGANPAMTNPNSEKVVKALKSLDLLVVRDLFMSETAALADYVLPAASYFERTELYTHPQLQVVGLTKRIFSIPEVQDEYQFLRDLAHRLGIGEFFPWENAEALIAWLVEPTGVSPEKISDHPEGYQYAPIRYKKYEHTPFNTRSGKIELASDYLKQLGYHELPVYKSPAYLAEPQKAYPYTLVTGARKLLYVHSRNRNFERFRTAIPEAEVEIHPTDGEKLGVVTGDLVRVTSNLGSIEIAVKITDEREILPGVIQITHGWKSANVNSIIDDKITDPISGFPIMKSTAVNIEKV